MVPHYRISYRYRNRVRGIFTRRAPRRHGELAASSANSAGRPTVHLPVLIWGFSFIDPLRQEMAARFGAWGLVCWLMMLGMGAATAGKAVWVKSPSGYPTIIPTLGASLFSFAQDLLTLCSPLRQGWRIRPPFPCSIRQSSTSPCRCG